MKIFLLTHSFNSLAQRFFVELQARGHQLTIELDSNDASTERAVAAFKPDIIIAPYLRRAIPESIWQHHLCIIIHPGIIGDRGPSSLDWAIINQEQEWGVTALQANEVMDGGDIWASASFPMRSCSKSSLYHNEVTEAAVQVLHEVLNNYASDNFSPLPLNYDDPSVTGQLRPLLRANERRIDWLSDDTSTVMNKINSGDGFPGVIDSLFGDEYHLYDCHRESNLEGVPGEIIAKRNGAICRATTDGALWIGHLKRRSSEKDTFKLPATMLLGERLDSIPESLIPWDCLESQTYQEISYLEQGDIGYLHFNFYNGAMDTQQCQRLLAAYRYACQQPTKVIVLMGGDEFWSNGIHLNVIEAADNPAQASWENINAINDLVEAIITTDDHLTISAMRGNAGGGGVFFALAADYVLARDGVILNPHYKNMGNLYGSEYWTYLLPKRVGEHGIKHIMGRRLPMGVKEAHECGLIDDLLPGNHDDCFKALEAFATSLLSEPELSKRLVKKRSQRAEDEAVKPLKQYRDEELQKMHANFFGFDPSYHVARYNFVYKRPISHTPLHLRNPGK